jgi:hypothetical protein
MHIIRAYDSVSPTDCFQKQLEVQEMMSVLAGLINPIVNKASFPNGLSGLATTKVCAEWTA